MLYYIGQFLADYIGPARLLTSYLFLIGLGVSFTALLTWFLLPKVWHLLPTDQGRAHAVGAAQSKGKPVSGGVVFIGIFILGTLLFTPFHSQLLLLLPCVAATCWVGYADDRSGGWSEYLLAVLDLIAAVAGAMILCEFEPVVMWFPLISGEVVIPPWAYIPVASGLIWVAINATNCSDGVDGLSGSLTSVAFLTLGVILYGILGHENVASYLLVPHYPEAADWGMLAFLIAGCLLGYLWHNANPSHVLMGDAGSRPLGFLLGVLVLATGNPLFIFIVAGVVLVNGATGLVKVALLRFFKIGIFRSVRYPLHDHYRHNYGWSNTQVLVRFTLVQGLGTALLLLLLFKIR